MEKYLDDEEKEIIESSHNEEWVSVFNDETNEFYKNIASNTINRSRVINLSISEKDFDKINAKAIQNGISYDALINLLVHNYNEGKIQISL
jgi:predicted DNA binding CopG/RHH family protein